MKKVSLAIVSSLFLLSLTACGDKESTPGEKLDAAIESTKEAAQSIDLEQAKEDAKAAAKKAQEEAKAAAEAAEEKAKEAAEATKKAAEDAKEGTSNLINSFKN